MKRILKFLSYLTLSGFALASIYAANLFLMKPYSLDHYLGKELVVGLMDSPEFMTYIGIFDRFSPILKHNQKLSISTLQENEEAHLDNIERLSILRSYNPDSLHPSQRVTQKIAIFDTENDIYEFENFRYHSYPFNQIGGNHLNLVEFMTDTHPVRNYREASDYIKRVKLFDEALNANLTWLQEQKKLGIFAPRYVFDHVIRQLNEMIAYKDSENPLMQVFIRKLEEIDVDEIEVEKLKSQLSSAIQADVKPGFQAILKFMEDNYESANEHHGVWSLPGGDDSVSYTHLRAHET